MVSSDRFFKVLARRNAGDYARLGMAVSRQVDRNSVGRNRIKRVIRESFRQSFGAVISAAADKSKNGSNAGAIIEGNNPGIDIVVMPRREAANKKNHQLFQSLQAHWSRLKRETG